MILSALGAKQKPHEMFASIAAVERDRKLREEKDDALQAKKLVSSGFLGRLIQDTGWDIEVDESCQ